MTATETLPPFARLKAKALRLNWRIADGLTGFPGEEVDWFYNYACLYAKRGNPTLAIRYLEGALAEDASVAQQAKKDRNFRSLANNSDFIRLLETFEQKPLLLRRFSMLRMLIFDLGALFTIISIAIFVASRQLGIVVFSSGFLLATVVEAIQALVLRQRLYFRVTSAPLDYGLVALSGLNAAMYGQGFFPLDPIIYGVWFISSTASTPFQWLVFGPRLKEYVVYRIQNISYGALSTMLVLLTIYRGGVLIRELTVADCALCSTYYALQVAFYAGTFIVAYFCFDRGVTLGRAQVASTIVSLAYVGIVVATLQSRHYLQAEYLVWFVILYSVVLLLTLIIAISEVYFNAESASQQRVTRYLVTAFFAIYAIQLSYIAAWNLGLLGIDFSRIELSLLNGVVALNLALTGALWLVFLRLKGASTVANFISISGVTSSSIVVGSPFATSLTSLDSSGKTETATTLMQLRDFVQEAKFPDEATQKHALEALESIAEEMQKPAPRKFTITTMIATLAHLASLATVASDRVPSLLERLQELVK
jgi:hypothetical protein